jgi:hypothetical protein
MPITNLPSAFSYENEKNPYLKGFKRTRFTKWSIKSSTSLRDMANLSANLIALKREDEAAMIGLFVKGSVHFSNDYNLWSPAAATICLGSYALRRGGRLRESQELMTPVVKNPSMALEKDSLRVGDIDQAEQELHTLVGQSDADVRVAAQSWIRTLIEFLEQSFAGAPGTAHFEVDRMSTIIEKYLLQLRHCIEK